MLQELFFGVLLLVGAIFGYLLFKHFSNVKRIEFYRAQGAYSPPGYDNLIVGHLPSYSKHDDIVASLVGTDKPAIPHPLIWYMNQTTESKKLDSFDWTKN